MSSKAPDTSGQNAAALQQAQLSKEQLDWAKRIYAETAPEREQATKLATEISEAQLSAMRKQETLADDAANFYNDTFRPIEQRLAAEAEAYDTPQRREAEAADAMGKVGSQFDVARASMAREASARGVNPNSGNFAASMGTMATQEAAAKAATGNAATKQVETMGYARRMDAAGLGRGQVSNQATSAGIALNQGNSSVGNARAVGDITAQGNQIMTQGYAGAQGGLAGAASTYGKAAELGKQDNSAMWGAVGSAIGTYGAVLAMSDEAKKTDIKPVDEDEALEAVERTPVSNWAYKAGTAPADGGQRHTGPMAQDVNRTMGEKAAPGGKKIDLVTMNGMTMAAVQALSKKVDRIMAAQGIPEPA